MLSPDFIRTMPRSVLRHQSILLKQIESSISPAERVYTSNKAFNYLASARDPETYGKHFIDLLTLDDPLLHKMRSVNGYTSLPLWNYQMILRRKEFINITADKNRYNTSDFLSISRDDLSMDRDRKILDILKVRYFISSTKNGDRLILNDLHPGKQASPFLMECGRTGGDAFPRDVFDPFTLHTAVNGKNSDYSMKRVSEQLVSVRAIVPCSGNFILSETYYPGWKVYEKRGGGWNELKLFERYNSIAVRLPRGEHTLKYVFSSKSTLIGATISLISLIAALIVVLAAFISIRPAIFQQTFKKDHNV
jgi:hypothetical protein